MTSSGEGKEGLPAHQEQLVVENDPSFPAHSEQDLSGKTSSASDQAAEESQGTSALRAAKEVAEAAAGKSMSRQQIASPQQAKKNDIHIDKPPLPSEPIPELPNKAIGLSTASGPTSVEDDGWAPIWDDDAQAFYFYNRFTSATQWENPRVPTETNDKKASSGAVTGPAPGTTTTTIIPGDTPAPLPTEERPRPAGGYDPAIHGDYDPNAWYAQEATEEGGANGGTIAHGADGVTGEISAYGATGAFNRFTGRWQAAELNPENFNDENRSRRQMNAFFDVDAAANRHDGRSLREERSGKKLSRQELRDFKEKRKARKEEKRRAWLRD